jgi:hypothetical protein
VAGTYGRTRPLCQFPAWPKYRGSGSLDAAVNYSCVTEVGDPLACPNLPAAPPATRAATASARSSRFRRSTRPPWPTPPPSTPACSARRAPQRSGTLLPKGNCSYASNESGAVFSFGAGGVLSGGVNAPSGGGFAPLVAFQNTFSAAPVSGDFKSIANIFNAVGVQQGTGGTSAQSLAVRLRNAGTFQYCRDPVSGGFMIYDANCAQTEKGYAAYNTTRASFDVFTTSPTGSAVTTGGTLSGSMVIGMVNGVAVPLHLVRESAANAGLRVFGLQQSLVPGVADGSYALVSVKGENHDATVAGSGFNLGGAAAALNYDTPVLGVAQADAGRPGNFIFNSGVLAFVSTRDECGAGTRSTTLKKTLCSLAAFSLRWAWRRCCPRMRRPARRSRRPAPRPCPTAHAATRVKTAAAPSTGSRFRRTGTAACS